MRQDHIVVIAVDGLRASALGAYGNTWYETPALDQLAASSYLAEWCFAGGVDLAGLYRSLWHAMHPLRPIERLDRRPSLANRLAACGYRTCLVSDEPQLGDIAGSDDFSETHWMTQRPAGLATSADETQFARLLSHAAAQLPLTGEGVNVSPGSTPAFVWVHSRGMYGQWDAPLGWRNGLAEQDDPDPYDGSSPPDIATVTESDPDAAFRYACGYAAQIQVFDACLGALVAATCDRPNRNPTDDRGVLFVLLGLRGFPLGEHGRIGGLDQGLPAEQIHVPLLLRLPNELGRLYRGGQLVELADLAPTILEWAEGHGPPEQAVDGQSMLPLLRGEGVNWRDHVVAGADFHRAIRTSAWSLRCRRKSQNLEPAADPTHLPDQSDGELFVRPDDRYESNNVADLCPTVVTGLNAALDDFEDRCRQNQPLPTAPLVQELVEPVY